MAAVPTPRTADKYAWIEQDSRWVLTYEGSSEGFASVHVQGQRAYWAVNVHGLDATGHVAAKGSDGLGHAVTTAQTLAFLSVKAAHGVR
jgi:hypothetical protein